MELRASEDRAREGMGAMNGVMAVDLARAEAQLGLSPQQARMVVLILQGKGDKEVAAELKIEVSTVRTYLGRLYQKLGVRTRMEMAVRVLTCVREDHPPRTGQEKP